MNIIEYHGKHMKLGGEIRADKKILRTTKIHNRKKFD